MDDAATTVAIVQAPAAEPAPVAEPAPAPAPAPADTGVGGGAARTGERG